MEWIKVEDRLPEEGKEYIGWDRGVGDWRPIWVRDGKIYRAFMDFVIDADITHWMEITEP